MDTGRAAVSLRAEHRPDAVRSRLAVERKHSYLSDAVLGGIDGCVTTFAVVTGAVGGGLGGFVVIVLGFASLFADGFSMAVSNVQSTKSRRQLVEKARREEERHIDMVPEGEREEIRQIYARKGFAGDLLDSIVAHITADRRLWVDTMLTEELGLQLEGARPLHAASVTFGAFVLVGLLPLLPFLFPGAALGTTFGVSSALAALAFFGIGLGKGIVLGHATLKSGFETLLTGGGAALLAYAVGTALRGLIGVGP